MKDAFWGERVVNVLGVSPAEMFFPLALIETGFLPLKMALLGRVIWWIYPRIAGDPGKIPRNQRKVRIKKNKGFLTGLLLF